MYACTTCLCGDSQLHHQIFYAFCTWLVNICRSVSLVSLSRFVRNLLLLQRDVFSNAQWISKASHNLWPQLIMHFWGGSIPNNFWAMREDITLLTNASWMCPWFSAPFERLLICYAERTQHENKTGRPRLSSKIFTGSFLKCTVNNISAAYESLKTSIFFFLSWLCHDLICILWTVMSMERMLQKGKKFASCFWPFWA